MGNKKERCIVCDALVDDYEFDYDNEVCFNCFILDDEILDEMDDSEFDY